MIDNRLVYILDKPKKKTDKCIVLAHGYTGNKNEGHNLFVKLSKALVKEGFAVLRFDFTGEGESPGKKPTLSPGSLKQEINDLTKVIDFAATKYRWIGLLGLSFGGCVALHTRHPWVKCLALWSALSYPYSLYPLNFPIDWWVGRHIRVPVLVATGEKDSIVPPLAQKLMYAVFPRPKKFVLIKGGEHTFNPATKQDEKLYPEKKVITETVAWFKQWSQ